MQLELQRQYVMQGRYDANIDAEVLPEPRNRVSINIDVDEGTVAAIKHINVVGNEVYDDEELGDLFELKTTGWLSFFTSDDKYSREKLTGDIETLTSYYMDRGYLQFSIDSTQVSVSPSKKEVYITANVTEGEKFTVSEVGLSGDMVLPEEDLRRFLRFEPIRARPLNSAMRGWRWTQRNWRPVVLVALALITVTLAAITALILWVQQAGGVVIWDPSVYYFTEIPSKMDMVSAAITMVGAVVFSLIGAFVPAAKAADMSASHIKEVANASYASEGDPYGEVPKSVMALAKKAGPAKK